MEMRSLDLHDFEALLGLVLEVYSDAPFAMWFARKPDAESFGPVFRGKVTGIITKNAIDLVALDAGKILGECEIVRRSGDVGMLGIIVSKKSRRMGVAGMLLAAAEAEAAGIGIRRLMAEVDERNASAVLFLAKKGFSMSGAVPRATGKGKAAVMLMLKEISHEDP